MPGTDMLNPVALHSATARVSLSWLEWAEHRDFMPAAALRGRRRPVINSSPVIQCMAGFACCCAVSAVYSVSPPGRQAICFLHRPCTSCATASKRSINSTIAAASFEVMHRRLTTPAGEPS